MRADRGDRGDVGGKAAGAARGRLALNTITQAGAVVLAFLLSAVQW
jgi:hypothetical protein